jgi:hypothetical protein
VIREFGEGPRNNVADMEHAAWEVYRERTTSLESVLLRRYCEDIFSRTAGCFRQLLV